MRLIWFCSLAAISAICSLGWAVSAQSAEPTCFGGEDSNTATSTYDSKTEVTTFVGTSGNDVIIGTEGADRIEGLGGEDRLCGLGGIDRVYGGAGNDRIDGGGGSDKYLSGGPDNDIVNGGDGADHVIGDNGEDELFGGEEGDNMLGGSSNDELHGEGGDDSLDGDNGAPTYGFGTADFCEGEAGTDAKVNCELPAPPGVTGISPSSGPETGGTTVTVSGHDFLGVSAVRFGSTSATSFKVTSPTSIEAVSPAGSGTVDVTVETTDDTSATSSADQFGYLPPHSVNAYDNYGLATLGHPMCRGNPGRPESMPGGTATQAFTVPAGVASLSSALVQIDPDSTVTAHLTLAVNGVASATATASAAGDTSFSWTPVPVKPGDEVALSISFTATFGKIITVYSAAAVGGTLTYSNSCSDGAPSGTTANGLRAVVSGLSP
jgi:IPT/TIG domain/RTX calcium-binding nonapeptide repeat (4 copies)